MNIEKILENNTLYVYLDGRLDTQTSPLFEGIINELENVNKLIIDMNKLSYISSQGLRIILKLQKIMSKNKIMILKGVKENVMEVFKITGFVDFLKFE